MIYQFLEVVRFLLLMRHHDSPLSVFARSSGGCEQQVLFGVVWQARPLHPTLLSQALGAANVLPAMSWHCRVWPRTCCSSAQRRHCTWGCHWFVGWSLKERGASDPICVTATCIWPLRIAFWKARAHKFSFSSQEGQLLCNWWVAETKHPESTAYLWYSVRYQLGQCKKFPWLSTASYWFCDKDSESENSPYIT